jgi:hypothetical protein
MITATNGKFTGRQTFENPISIVDFIRSFSDLDIWNCIKVNGIWKTYNELVRENISLILPTLEL